MVFFTTSALSFAAAAVLAATGTDAHGTLSKPGLTFTGTGYGGNFQSNIPLNSLTAQSGDSFTNYPDYAKNSASFARALKASKYKSLKHFMYANQDMSTGRFNMPKTAECGFTDPVSGVVQQLPGQLEWYGGQMIHDGPCEVWCDDEVVLPFTDNCRVTYPGGVFPYEKAKCQGKNRLTMYWMSTLMEWQVYIDCAKIGEGGLAASNDTAAITAAAAKADSSFPTGSSDESSATDTANSNATSETDAPSVTSATPAPVESDSSIGGEASSNTTRCNGKWAKTSSN